MPIEPVPAEITSCRYRVAVCTTVSYTSYICVCGFILHENRIRLEPIADRCDDFTYRPISAGVNATK